jgi:uroporphyrin-III C-methyltransferase
MTGTVCFVGAGPGDPDLLTVKAYRLIRSADVLLHDDLVSAEIVCLAAPHARVVNVGKRCGVKKITQAEINAQMIDAARRGLEVVRLKSGDPAIFGRLAEEIDALESAGISYEVVPGITAGVAAAASLGSSLTDRRTASRIIVISGHHAGDDASSANLEAALRNSWRGLAREDATFVIYMPGRNLHRIQRDLLDAGFVSDFPAVIISRVSAPDQREWATTLADLHDAPPMEAPSILLLGRTFTHATRAATSRVLAAVVQDSNCSSLPDFA